VIYYHGVTKRQRPAFRRQMEWLKPRCSVIPFQSLVAGQWSGRAVCITFDDALDNVRQNALPILREMNMPATVFAVPGNLGREPSWTIAEGNSDRYEILSTAEQLKEYPPHLVEIGSHTMSHPDLSKLSGVALTREVLDSKRALESLLGREVSSLSVPYGSYNQDTLRAARDAGYSLVATCDPVVARAGERPFTVGRFKVAPDDWGIEFQLKASGAHQWRRAWQNLKGYVRSGKSCSDMQPAPAAQAELTK
jgi:peptidoglycan/xylan/chitin deacetylase (PgdA/CDA1 family)